MPKVKFIGKGTQYHPVFGKLVEGEEYYLPGGYPKDLFVKAKGDSSTVGEVGPAPLQRTNLPDLLTALKMDDLRALRDDLAKIDSSISAAQDTSKRELATEMVEAISKSTRQDELLAVVEARLKKGEK